jgi:hypothetical protein
VSNLADDGAALQRQAKELFNLTWDLLDRPERSAAEDDRMLHAAHASRFLWGEVGAPENLARGEWQCSRVYAVLGRSEPALHHGMRCLELCTEHGIADWDLAFAHEAVARAWAAAGDADRTREALALARAACAQVADDEDRSTVEADLATVEIPPD